MHTRERALEQTVALLLGLRAGLRAALDDAPASGAPAEVRARLAVAVSELGDALLLAQHGHQATREWTSFAEAAIRDAQHALAIYAAWESGFDEAGA